MTQPKTMNVEPTPDGYARIAATFLDSVIGDVVPKRKTDSRKLLFEGVKLAVWLAQNHPDSFEALYRHLDPDRIPGKSGPAQPA